MPQFRCLSIRQPYVELILRGEKPIEYRTWKTDYTGPLAIHASSSREEIEFLDARELKKLIPSGDEDDWHFGHVIGIVDLVACSAYADLPSKVKKKDGRRDNWHWMLANPRRLARPLKMKGAASIFFVEIPASSLPGNSAEETAVAPSKKKSSLPAQSDAYKHPESTSPMRPDVGTQAQFKKKKPAVTYRYDSSLSPALDWDENPAREMGEALVRQILDANSLEDAKAAAAKLKALGKPFLDWAGNAERLSFDVPTLPLFIHERLSTKEIIESLKGHKRQLTFDDLWSDPEHSISDQVMRAYEYPDKWTNRMILGDSLVVMNSLLHYENLGGQVQMIYIDPPYGIKYGSNFQPFVRKRSVSHNDDEDFSREPEMVQAYRDTWEMGLHSYLTYMRDRLLMSRDLLHPSGSVFVQISTENIHHLREILDEVFGAENCVAQITFKKTAGQTALHLPGTIDFLLWYARDRERLKYRSVFTQKSLGDDDAYVWIELEDGTRRRMTDEERSNPRSLPPKARAFTSQLLQSQRQGRPSGPGSAMYFPVEFEGKTFHPSGNRGWTTTRDGMSRLRDAGRFLLQGNSIRYLRYFEDFPVIELTDLWSDTQSGSAMDRYYVVQTNNEVIQRCLLMTTDPGDLVLDPTCGSGTTAFVAEQWGRRWITADVSRVPLALARQRLLTATFPWYELKDADRGPAGGFTYKRKQNNKGEEVGGIVPHVTLKSIANNEPPAEEVLVDRPEIVKAVTRVTGPFTVEATIPTAMDVSRARSASKGRGIPCWRPGSREERMLEILRKSPVLRLDGNKTITFKNVRPPAKSLSLSAEAIIPNGDDKAVAFVFGPENGPISEKLVYEAAREAHAKSYTHLFVIGFAIEAKARQFVEQCADVAGVPATYVQATPDLLMGDLLKNMRSSQIFSVYGLPEIEVKKIKAKSEPDRYQVALLGLDVFDPVTMENQSREGKDVPAWFLDTDYNGLCFHVCQAFFPRTSAWDNLKKALKADYKEELWDHLAGTTSAPFEAGDKCEIAVKVIDDRGNELMVVKKLG